MYLFISFLLGDASCFFKSIIWQLHAISFGVESEYNIELLYLAMGVHGSKRDRELYWDL